MINYYIDEVIRRLRMSIFNRKIKNILTTPPLRLHDEGPLVLSMVHHRDVLSYLLAVKSFSRYVSISQVVIVADKTINETDRKLLHLHVPGVIIRDASEFKREGIPSGGCWERLIAISNYVGAKYVIQLDADTLTFSVPISVIDAVKNNISFTLGTYDLQSKVDVGEVARWAQSHCLGNVNPHIQLLCESKILAASDGVLSKVYIRGCAGFSGFGAKSFSENDIKMLSLRMATVLNDKWSEWGTEQFASNYIISNIDKSIALPHPVYTTPDLINHTTVFVHFIGPLRYSGGKYLNFLRKFLHE